MYVIYVDTGSISVKTKTKSLKVYIQGGRWTSSKDKLMTINLPYTIEYTETGVKVICIKSTYRAYTADKPTNVVDGIAEVPKELGLHKIGRYISLRIPSTPIFLRKDDTLNIEFRDGKAIMSLDGFIGSTRK